MNVISVTSYVVKCNVRRERTKVDSTQSLSAYLCSALVLGQTGSLSPPPPPPHTLNFLTKNLWKYVCLLQKSEM